MTGASDTLDPIQAAEAGIAGSKHLIASVANDLSQQERWLAHYRVAERRHARRLWFQELIYQLELRRQRLMRWSKRLALIALRWARSAAQFLSRTAVSLVSILRRVTTACFVWLRPRAYALALALAEMACRLLSLDCRDVGRPRPRLAQRGFDRFRLDRPYSLEPSPPPSGNGSPPAGLGRASKRELSPGPPSREHRLVLRGARCSRGHSRFRCNESLVAWRLGRGRRLDNSPARPSLQRL